MRSVESLRSTKLPTTGLDQCFSTQITLQPVTIGQWLAKPSLLNPILPFNLLHLNFKQEWFGDCSRSITKYFLWTNLVLVEERKVFFNIPLFFCCDPFKIFQVLLLGHDPAVERPWSRPFCLIKLYILLFVNFSLKPCCRWYI